MGKKGGKKGKIEKIVENASPLPTIPEEGDNILKQSSQQEQATSEDEPKEPRKSQGSRKKSILSDVQDSRRKSAAASKSVVIEETPTTEAADNEVLSANPETGKEPQEKTETAEEPKIVLVPEKIDSDLGSGDKEKKKGKGKKGKKDKKEETETEELAEDDEEGKAKQQKKSKKGKKVEAEEGAEDVGEGEGKGAKKGKKGKKEKATPSEEDAVAVEVEATSPDEGVKTPAEGKKSKKKGKKDKIEKAEVIDVATEIVEGEMPKEEKSKRGKKRMEKLEAEESDGGKKGKKGKRGPKDIKPVESDLFGREPSEISSKSDQERSKSMSYTGRERSIQSIDKGGRKGKSKKGTKKRGEDKYDDSKRMSKHSVSSLKDALETDSRRQSSRVSASYSEASGGSADIDVDKDEKDIGRKKKKDKKAKKAEEEELTEEEREEKRLEKEAEKKALKAEKKAAKKAARLEAIARKKAEKALALGEDVDIKKRLEDMKKQARAMGINEQSIGKAAGIFDDEGAKKKPSKKDKAKISAEMAEKAKAEQEAQAKRLEELLKKKKEEDRLAAIEKEKREIYEQGLRVEQLSDTYMLIAEVIQFNSDVTREEKEILDWQKYVACGKLPNPAMCNQMNTYLHLWGLDLEKTSIEEASSRTTDTIKLLNDLDEVIDTVSAEESHKLENWKWVRQLFRDYQASSLDVATYRLLRDVEHNLNRINIPTADFNFKDESVTLCIWLRVMLPIPLPNPRRPPKPRIDISFNLMDVSALFPLSIDCENAALRAMYLKYDHLSDLNETFYMPHVPEDYYMDLFAITQKEWRNKLKYKYDNRDKVTKSTLVRDVKSEGQKEGQPESEATEEIKSAPEPETEPLVEVEKKMSIKFEEGEGEPIELETTADIPIVPFKQLKPSPSTFAISLEDELYEKTRNELRIEVPENVINLRKFLILGGVFHLNLLAQPPQPQDFITMDMTITGLYLPKKLEVLPFKVVYTPYVPPPDPEPTDSNTSVRKLPEELEEEQKKAEEELDKLILINIKWPQHVIFLELPIVCRWDDVEKRWSSEEIHDVKHNEDKCMLSFRTGVFGMYALAAYRYSNLPFQAYDIKPEIDESVTVQLTAAILMLEFNIKDGLIAITQLQNSPNMTLQDCVGKYMKLHKLKRMMKEAGIDIFPEFDAFCYVDGSCEKQWAMEQHLYYNMAQISNCFNFAWSRWNLQAGRRQIVLQMRQYFPDKGKQKNHQMLFVTPLKATFVDCTEVSPAFSDKDMESLKFSADLYHLMKITNGIFVRNKVSKANKQNVYTLAQFLISIRILSFS